MGALVVTACSSDTPSEGPPADQAAGAITSGLRLPTDTEACLTEQLQNDDQARALLDPGALADASPGDRQALTEVMDACVTPDVFAAAVASSISGSIPAASDAATEAQTQCLHDAVVGLPDDERSDLVLGVLALDAPIDSDLAVARGDIVNGLYTSCGVTVQAGGDGTGSASSAAP